MLKVLLLTFQHLNLSCNRQPRSVGKAVHIHVGSHLHHSHTGSDTLNNTFQVRRLGLKMGSQKIVSAGTKTWLLSVTSFRAGGQIRAI